MSIRLKLIITFIAIASIPLLFISALTFSNYRNSIEFNKLAHLEDIVAFKIDKIETYFASLKSEIEITQSFYNIRKNLPILARFAGKSSGPEYLSSKKMLDEQLKHMQSVLRLFDIMLVDKEGRIVYTSSLQHHAKEISKPFPEHYEKAFAEGKNKIYFSDIFFNETEGNKPAMLVTAPVLDISGVFMGVIVFEVDLNPMYEVIRDVTGLGNTGETLIGKKINNQVVFLNPLRHDPNAALAKKVTIGDPLGEPIQEAAKGKFGTGQLTDYRGKKVIAAWGHIPTLDWGIVAKIDADEAFASAINLRNTTIIILAIIIALGAIMAFPIAGSISGPIKKLSIGAEIIGKGNLNHKVSINSKDELGQLSRAFNKMTHDLINIIASRDELNREITARKRLEESLKLSTLKYSTILQTSQSGYMLSNMEGKLLEVNDAYCRMTGYSRDELLKMYIKEFELNENPEEILAQINLVREKGYLQFERRNRRKDGTSFDIEISTSYLDIEGGLMVVFTQDITERKKSERIKQSRIRMLETANKITTSLDEVLQVSLNEIEALTNSSIGFYHFLKDDQETLLLQQWSTNTIQKMCTAEGKDSHYPVSKAGVWVDCIHQKRPVIHNDYKSLPNRKGLPEGHAPVIREMVIPVIRAGKIMAIIGVGNKLNDYNTADIEIALALGDFSWEIVERIRIEEELKENEKRLKRAQEIGRLGSWELDLLKNRLSWSDEVYRIFGLKPQEFTATYEAFLDAIHPDDRAAVDAAYSGSILEKRDTYEIEHRIVKKSNGEIRFVHEKCEHIRDLSGKIIRSVGMVQDITERKKAEDNLKRANENLEQFAYVASHDLQEPLRTMSSYSQLLAQRYKSRLDTDADDFIDFITDAANRMQKLIIDLLAYSRIGRIDMQKAVVDCNSVLGKVITILSSVIEETGTVITHDTLPVSVCNESNFIQLFQNLISNAIKFHGKEAPHIHISAKKQENVWLFSVSDNGIGIDEKYKEKIFLIFQRLHGRDKYPGTGIGLSICKKIVETHGGRIWVESQVGKGTTFYFTIPDIKSHEEGLLNEKCKV